VHLKTSSTAAALPEHVIEEHIIAIWEELFNTRPVCPDDDFFVLGGQSLLAAQMLARLSTEYGLTVDPYSLLHCSTPRTLAAAIAGTVGSCAEARRDQFFWFDGSLEPDRINITLPHHLGSEFDVQTLTSTLDRRAKHEVDCGELVQHLTASVRAKQPHGPYALGGYCHAGYLALEVARTLRDEGEEVREVVVAHTPFPSPALSWLRRILGPPAQRFSRGEHSDRDLFLLTVYCSQHVRDFPRHTVPLLLKRGWRRLRDGRTASGPRPEEWSQTPLKALLRTARDNDASIIAWWLSQRSVRQYDGRVTLLCGPHEELLAGTEWRKKLPRSTVVRVPWDHGTSPRHGAEMAAVIRDVLTSEGHAGHTSAAR
jgi:acyl carrier protein